MAILPRHPQARFAVITTLLLVAAVVIAGIWLGNWLVAIILALLVALAQLVYFLLRNLVSSEREERLDRGYADVSAAPPPTPGADLPTRFKRSVAELRASRLGRESLYALPWYLVIGDTGAGKSALIAGSGLDLPAEFSHVAHGGATRDCEWWFTNEAVVLDTAGRYTTSDADPDRQEWRQLLRLLRRTRPKRPVNGIVVAVSATRLLTAGAAALEEDARTLRRRLNEVTDHLSLDAPIYVLVTQLDRVEGFTEVVAGLPPNRLVEAFGFTNNERRFADAGDLVSRALERIRDRIDTLVGEMLLREGDPVRRRRVQGFPHELEALSAALTTLLRAAFAPSVYEETPFLRGVYLTSAQQGGATTSAVLARLGQEPARAEHPPSAPGNGWFLRGLFRDVIVGDQNLAIPQSTLGPRARRALLATGAALCAAALAAWGIAAWQVVAHQNRVVEEARRTNDAPSSLEAVDRLRRAIAAGDEVTVLNRLGLGPALDRALDDARDVFLWAFGTYFEEHAKTRLRADVRKLDPQAFEALAELSLDLTWLRTRAGAPPEQRPRLADYAPRIGRNETDRVAFADCYDAFVRWAPLVEIERRLDTERRTLATASSTVLSIEYLERWSAENRDARPPLRYQDLGLPRPRESVRDAISAAYTRSTWEGVVRGLLTGVEETKGASEASIRKFARSYVVAHDAAWERFLLNAPTRVVADARVKDSPYAALLRRIREEMDADLPRDVAAEPGWVAMIDEVLREEPLEPAGDDEEAEEAAPWTRYQVALEEVAKDVEIAQASPEDALKTAVEAASTDATSFDKAIDEIRGIVPGGDPEIQRKLREILEMPVLNGLRTVLVAATEELDREWRAAIAGPFGGDLSESELAELYGADDGALRQFQDTWLEPFFRAGIARPVLRDVQMPFGPEFLEWLDSARKVQQTLEGVGAEIPVRLVGVPSRVITGGVVESKRILQVDCTERLLSLEYRPSRAHTIPWTPGCAEVKLRVSVLENGRERELPVRTWRGPLALPSFFQAAERDRDAFVWRVEDRDRGIELAVPYRMRSGQAILDVSHRAPPDSVGS